MYPHRPTAEKRVHRNTSAWCGAKPGQWFSGQTSSASTCARRCWKMSTKTAGHAGRPARELTHPVYQSSMDRVRLQGDVFGRNEDKYPLTYIYPRVWVPMTVIAMMKSLVRRGSFDRGSPRA